MEQLEGYVEHITYRNEENGYTVLTLECETESHVLTGVFATLEKGEYIRAYGEKVIHPVYGEQIQVENYEFVAPQDTMAILRYLSSGAIKGIKEKLAARIVDYFGEDTFRILEEEPERLVEIKGISENGSQMIAAQVVGKRDLRNALLYLQQFGISFHLSTKIYKIYGMELYRILRENPYKLAEDIEGIGFKTADGIARKMGMDLNSEFRIRAGILYALSSAVQNGNTYLPEEDLYEVCVELLGFEFEEFSEYLEELMMDKRIVIQRAGTEKRIYLSYYHHVEAGIAFLLNEMNVSENTEKKERISKRIQMLEKESGIRLAPEQREAVLKAAGKGVTILTGGPGTGKTTTINMIIRYYIREGYNVALAAPTGRAAKRMQLATGYEAQTIHRLLEVKAEPGITGEGKFQRGPDYPLETDAVIVDEMSMVDVNLMYALLRAMAPGMRLVLVGDGNQLPSVGPGEVLKHLIESNRFPVVQLSRIFRQAEESDIIMNAHKIKLGEKIEVKKSRDFLFILRNQVGTINGAVITLLKEKLPGYVQCDPLDIQVLTPMRKGLLGSINMNRILQEALNPKSYGKQEKTFSFGTFREGDKVMQVKNDYHLEWEIKDTYPPERGEGIYNGDTGRITEISEFEETITVEFEDHKIVKYPFTDGDELELAYAVTIHKSQGSEYPAVILPLLSGPERLMTRNLLYTGVTRARKCVCIVGEMETFQKMVENSHEMKRYSGLKEMILNHEPS